MYIRDCPSCNKKIEYKSNRGRNAANKNKTSCPSCRNVSPRTLSIKKSKWYRECPSCGQIKYYSSKRNWKRAVESNSTCPTCHPGPDKKTRKKISLSVQNAYKTGTLTSNGRPPRDPKKEKWFRNCPRCDIKLGYASRWSKKRADDSNTLCNSCSCIVYKKGFLDGGLSDDSIKQMRATKAGYSSWSEYKEKYPDKKFYKQEVWKHTYQQPIEQLENWDRRGLCGVSGAYQLDHIISINEGYENNIPPEKIGNISNLQMLPWRENRNKGA